MTKRFQALFPALIVFTLLASCVERSTATTAPEQTMVRHSLAPSVAQAQEGEVTGLRVRLSEGVEQLEPITPVPEAVATPLPESEVAGVLRRLPVLQAPEGDQQEFAFPKSSLPPPRPGETIKASFPPTTTGGTPAEVAAGPLEVLRHAPDGEVPVAPYLNLTFSEPMVALTSHEDLALQDVPVRLSPPVPGTWRWVGTKTLMFDPAARGGEPRFPMATHYTATVPAGTTSANGATLAQDAIWTFTTPRPQIQAYYPGGGPQRRETLMFVAFDQHIEPDAVLPTIKVRAGNRESRLQLATPEEIKADDTVRRMSEDAGEGRWLAFKAVEPFPTDTNITVTVGPGTPSAEGPLVTTSAQTFEFRTYGPLQVIEHRCGWDNQCPPLSPWSIRFNNPLDPLAFDPAMVKINPEIPGARIELYGETILIQGMSKGRTTYRVTLSAAVQDQFDQTLGKDQILTFAVGSAPAAITSSGGNFVVLDPSAKPAYSVYTINYDRLKVRIYAVGPEDWSAYGQYLQNYFRDTKGLTPPGREVFNQTVRVESSPDEIVETAIDLSPAMVDGLGQAIVVVEPEAGGLLGGKLSRSQPPVVQAWVQSSRIGLDAFVDHHEMIAWANALVDGAPLSGVELTLLPGGKTGQTGNGGLATLDLPAGPRGAELLVARRGGDVSILPQNRYWWGDGDGWRQQPLMDAMRWFVFDDRAIYRPGEEVHVKGFVRRMGSGETGDISGLEGAAKNISYRLMDSQGNEVSKGTATVDLLGGFDMAFSLPDAMNLGQATLLLIADGPSDLTSREYNHVFRVEEFRRPEFEVSAGASEGPHFIGGHAITSVTAKYFAGGTLPNVEVFWEVRSATGHFSPPGWDEWTFGNWRPWWEYWDKPYGSPERVDSFEGRTDAAGQHHLRIDFESVSPPEPSSVTAQATVMDVNRQAWTAQTELLVHPAALYVGLRTERMFVEREDPLEVEAIVVDLDGKSVPGVTVSMRAARLDWKYQPLVNGGSWQEEETAVQPCTLQSAREPVLCTFETPEGGTYRITATIQDSEGRANQTQMLRWVTGGKQPPARNVEQEQVTLVPDLKEYQPGDTAEILVQAPFSPAEGVLTLRRSGIVSSERFTMEGSSHTLRIPITEAYIPNVNIQVDLVGSAPRTDDKGEIIEGLPPRPAFASGSLNLVVPPLSRTLSLEVTPEETALEPGGTTTVDVQLKDAAGKPVEGGEVAVVVVDEAVLALTGYQLPDPVSIFYSERPADATDYHLRSNIVLPNPAALLLEGGRGGGGGPEAEVAAGAAMPAAPAATMAPAADARMTLQEKAMDSAYAGDADQQAPPIALRTDFNALATFAPALPTDAQGRSQVEVKLPDNLTRYRVMAVAVAGGKQFGAGESSITARLPLMVRASPPRFLNFGDRFELPVVVQNQTGAPMTVTIAAQATNIAFLPAGLNASSDTDSRESGGFSLVVPANDRREVRFPATTVQAGTARFQVAATSGKWADASEFSLPVWTPATTEAFATYGQIDEGAIAQPVIPPSDVYTQFGGLEISTSSTALQALTDAVLYLVSYPFDCSEQMASRILAVAALRDVLTAFKAEGLPAPQEIENSVAKDIETLRGIQNEDGGFPFWRRGEQSWPYLTIHVTHALQRARDKDFKVPDDMLSRSMDYLQKIEQYIPSWYGPEARRSLIAYALYVRNLAGDRDAARARRLIQETGLEKLSMEAIGWLLPVLSGDTASNTQVEAIRKHLNNRVTETAGAASFVTSYGADDYLLLHSDRRTDAVILDALIVDQPQSDLIPKLVQGLLAHRTKGRWNNTQENAFVLLALDHYFNTYEAQTPDFVARMWLGDQYAGEHAFQGRTTERYEINIPMSFLGTSEASQDLVLSKEGAGRLYYRLGMSYAPRDLTLEPIDHGFTIERVYEAIDNPNDVRRDADGTWHVKAGARVRIRLTMVAQARRYHVALVDPLPAGFETLNPSLAVSGSLPPEENPQESRGRYWWWWGPWYEHQNLRDHRAEAFTSLLWDGVYTYSYTARATTPGQFVVPPPKAEEMYSPETFGRGATDRVIVE